MTRIITGTPEATGEHIEATAILGATIAYGILIALAVAGIVEFGWNTISWTGANACGAIAAFAFFALQHDRQKNGHDADGYAGPAGQYVCTGTFQSEPRDRIYHA